VKSNDYYFVGFPALWNLMVLIFHILQSDPWANLAILAVCAVMTFVPLKYVHPFRVREFRRTSLAVTAVWAAASLALVLAEPRETDLAAAWPAVFWTWVAASAYFAALSLWRSVRGAASG
jgi:phosphatidylcholine synthase